MVALKISMTDNIHRLSYRTDLNKYKPPDSNIRPQAVLLQTEGSPDKSNNICNFCRASQYHKLTE